MVLMVGSSPTFFFHMMEKVNIVAPGLNQCERFKRETHTVMSGGSGSAAPCAKRRAAGWLRGDGWALRVRTVVGRGRHLVTSGV